MLFKTNNKLLEYAELTAGINFASVAPTIRVVETQHIIPVIGKELYTSLNDAYTLAALETDLTQIQIDLLDKCRCVIGPMLCYYYAPKAEVKLSDSGAQRMETNNAKTAYQNQVTNFREQNLREAEVATELLLEFLEENKDDYPDWVASEAFTDYRSLFIKSGKEFDKLFTSHSPYRNYWAMRSKMLEVEQGAIRALLGDTFFDELKSRDAAANIILSTQEKELLFKLKKAIAYLTVAFAIPFLNVRIDANGITVMNSNTAQNDNVAKRTAADTKSLDIIIEKSENAARTWINNAEQFIKANADYFVANYLITSTGNFLLVNGSGSSTTDQDQSTDDTRVTDSCSNESSGSYGLI